MTGCSWPGCNQAVDRYTYCWQHANLMKIPKPVKEVYRIPARSLKRIKEQPVYRKIVAQKIENVEGVCMIQSPECTYWADGLQHIVKRSPDNWLRQDNSIPCCSNCNGWVERNPNEAIEKGFSKSKFLKL